jgi:hypothetical protein
MEFLPGYGVQGVTVESGKVKDLGDVKAKPPAKKEAKEKP